MRFLDNIKDRVKEVPKETKKVVAISTTTGLILGTYFGLGISPSCTRENHKGIEDTVTKLEETIELKETEISELSQKVEEASPWFEMKEQERKEEEERIAREQAEKEEAERKAQEEAERKAQEEAERLEKQGYDTGITYNQLARTPDDYLFQKVKFKGKVIQVMEGDDVVQIRLAVGGDYDKVLLAEYDSDIVSSRVLEDDQITIMGLSCGLITYQSTMGGNITIPSVLVDKIDQ